MADEVTQTVARFAAPLTDDQHPGACPGAPWEDLPSVGTLMDVLRAG